VIALVPDPPEPEREGDSTPKGKVKGLTTLVGFETTPEEVKDRTEIREKWAPQKKCDKMKESGGNPHA